MRLTVTATTLRRACSLFTASVALAACASGPRITTIKELSSTADAPYDNILVVALYSKFDSRRYFEDELVRLLREQGVNATASTSRMNTKTPVNRDTFVAMVRDLDADALLLTQMVSLKTEGEIVAMNPKKTLNLRPTGYYNVFTMDVTEYVEPEAVNFEHAVVLLTDLYSAQSRDIEWGIQSASDVKVKFDRLHDFSVIQREARAIVQQLARDGLLAR